MVEGNKLVQIVTNHYLTSRDFNGLLLESLHEMVGGDSGAFLATVADLIRGRQIAVVFGDIQPNPYIRAFPDEPPDKQVAKLSEACINTACAYPARDVLVATVNRNNYPGKPYTLELALGAGQLEFRAFDLVILEHYRNDPRYHYDNDDIHGCISVGDAFYRRSEMLEKDKTLLKSFGFCYDDSMNRAVAAFVTDLAGLTPEHQQIWKAKELEGGYKLHPDYYRNCILGEWGTKIPIFGAFIQELTVINAMAQAMGRAPLFRDTYASGRPREFGFLVRPTLREYNAFVHLLDKMVSDNIDKAFFGKDLAPEVEETRKDGKIIVREKGSLQMLREWVEKFFKPIDPGPVACMFDTLKSIRKQRQPPAHAVKEDEFDQEYFRRQRKLIIDAYRAIRLLRLILANHPAVKADPPKIDELLVKGEIWTY